MDIPRYFDDWDEFTHWCWWWIEIKNWMDAELPPGYRFAEAFDAQHNFRIYAVTFQHWNRFENEDIYHTFDRSTGTMQVS